MFGALSGSPAYSASSSERREPKYFRASRSGDTTLGYFLAMAVIAFGVWAIFATESRVPGVLVLLCAAAGTYTAIPAATAFMVVAIVGGVIAQFGGKH